LLTLSVTRVDVLVSIAEDLLRNAKPEELHDLANSVIPGRETWRQSLEPFLGLPPRPSTAITSSLGGIVHLVSSKLSDSFWEKLEGVARDSNRASSAFRLTSYAARVLALPKAFESLNTELRETLFYYFPLAVQLIDDDLSIEGSIGITGLELSEDREDYMEIVNKGRSVINSWISSTVTTYANNKSPISDSLSTFWERTIETITDTSPESYRLGEVFAKIMPEVASHKKPDLLMLLAREIRKMNPVRAAATLAVWGPGMVSNPAGTRLCNELVAEVTGINPEKDLDESKYAAETLLCCWLLILSGVKFMSLFNIIAQGEESVVASVPTQRLIFLVKHILQVSQSRVDFFKIRAEILKILTIVLRSVSDIYGSHWAESIELLSITWKETNGGDASLPSLHASLRLFALLKSMVNGEGNDDLEDAWTESKSELFSGLVSVLGKLGT
jgi:hypothetical protein